MKYVNVVINNKSRFTDVFYTYRAPDSVKIGDGVKVTFGKGKGEKDAYVFQTDVAPSCDVSKIKDIVSVSDFISLTPEMVETCMWMKQRYAIKYIDAVRCFVPSGKPPKPGKEKKPLKDREGETQDISRLTPEQKNALNEIYEALEERKQENFLLYGVTGSGKTEVYMRAAERTIALGRKAIIMVPEIALAGQITERFIGRFGKDRIAVLHSRLTGRERFDEWTRIRKGEADIIIGARMAVFAPAENIGLIVMDEEHEATYKSDMTPKYDAVDIAVKRLMACDGVLIAGSATPSVVSYNRAEEGIYRLLKLEKRYNENPLPEVEIVDMKDEIRAGNFTVISRKLHRLVGDELKAGRQAILFLNRRGYSTYIFCEECGAPLKCPDCGISLTYHKGENAAVCHYCGRKFPAARECPECGGKLKYSGKGTEKVTEQVSEMFPEATVERLDLDTAVKRSSISRILKDFGSGKTDILIGTQIVAKGLDFKNVGLVGVIDADVSLNIPDYRSPERTFQLITQVSGRAGRGDGKGRVIVQTTDPENAAVKAAAAYDYESFYREEIRMRRLMKYPPFSDIIAVETFSRNVEAAETQADETVRFLSKKGFEEAGGKILGPRESRGPKNRDGFAFRLLLKCPKGERNRFVYYLNALSDNMAERKYEPLSIDINPYGMI